MDSRIAAFIHYYAREGYPHHVQSVCNEVLKHGGSPGVQFWRAYGLLASGATAEVQHQQLFGITFPTETASFNLRGAYCC